VGTWAASTAALNNTSGMTFTNAVVPDSGRTFTWSIAPEAMVIDSYSTVGVTTGAITGTSNNAVIAAVVYTHGDSARKAITQLAFTTTGTSSIADLTAAKVYYSGTNAQFDLLTSTQFGSTYPSPSGTMYFAGNEVLNPGPNYFWLVYDLSASAPSGNVIDGQCLIVTEGFGNNNTPNITSPAGSRRIIVPMNGTYTINPAGAGANNFLNFDSALNSLYINGVSGPVKFLVSPGTYTLTSSLRINNIPEANSTNNVVFEGVNKATTILTGNLPSLGVVTLNTKYVTIRNFTITNTAAGTGSGVVILGSTTLNTGSGCKVNNCIISMPNIGTSTGTSIAMTIDQTGTSFGSSVLMDSVEIDSNICTSAYYGIGIYGALNISFNKGIKIRNNTFSDINQYGIYLQYVMNTVEVLNNDITNRGSGYGIYLNRCEGANTSHLISGNKVKNFSIYGIYHFSGTSSLPMVSRIYNNLVISPASSAQNCIYVSLLAPSPIEVYHNTAIYNFATTTATYGPFYAGGSPNIKVKNNIFVNNVASGGTNCAAYIATSPTGNDINYNVYYNRSSTNKNAILRGGVTYYDSTFKTTTAGGDSSFWAMPPFNSEYKLSNACSPKSGLDLTSIIPVDIEGETRSTTPYIGCDETVAQLNDMGIDSLLAPKSPITGGPTDMVLRVKNYGSNTVYSFTAGYVHNGAPAVTQIVTQQLNSCDTFSVAFTGGQQINLTGTNLISTFTNSPNSVADDDPANDTLKVNLFGPLSGVYTIGGTNPSFVTITEAVTALQNSGVAGPVTFNVAPGTYTGQVVINGSSIAGMSAATPIRFEGANAATTIITAAVNQQGAVLINQCNYVSFRNFTVNNTSSANPVGIAIVGNATASNNGTGCSVKKCIVNISCGVNQSYGISVTSSVGGYGNSATWADSVTIDSNTVTGPYYGVTFYGRQDSSRNKEIKFRNNTISAFYYGMYIYYIFNPVEVLYNTVNMFTPLSSATPYAYSGIYMTANTTYSPSVPSRVSNNKVTGFQNYGIYMTNIGTAAAAKVQIYNNYATSMKHNAVRSIYISSSTGGAEIYHNTFIYNAGNATQTYGAGYFTGAFLSNTFIQNNIFANMNTAGNNTPLYVASTSPANNIDYNIYYNKAITTLVNRAGIYYTTANYKTSTAGGANSFNAEPVFVDVLNNLHVTVACSPRGANLNASVPMDIDGDTRGTPGQIGADEYVSVSLDAIAEAVTQPVYPASAGAQNLVATIRNNGSSTLTSVNVAYKLNAAAPVSQLWTGSLAPCASANVTFTGAQQINLPAGSNTITVYTSSPNSGVDGVPANDTVKVIAGTPLAGSFVIGSAPSDYTTFNAAVDDMKARGVAGAVTFNVKTGTYNEQVFIPAISGASSTNTITFKAQTNNRNDVTLNYNSNNASENYVVRLAGNYINMKTMTLASLHTTYGHVVELVGTSSYDTIMNCNITSVNSATTSADRANIYSYPMLGASNVILSNTISYGAYSVYIYGVSTTVLTDGIVIDGNTLQAPYYTGVLATYMNNIKTRNNTYIGGTYGYSYAIYLQYADNNVEVTGNTINMPNGGYGVYLYECDGSATTGALIANNIITIGGAGTSGYGINNNYGSYTRTVNNSVNITNTSTSTYAGYFYWSNTGNSNHVVFNNIFANNVGYAVYAYNSTTSPSNRYDYNFLSSNGANLGATASPSANYTTLAAWRAAMPGHEKNSLTGRVPYISPTNLAIDLNDSNAWLLNGNGVQLAGNSVDMLGNPRSTTLIGGAPDLGAFEITPNAIPPAATAIPATPAAGTTQVFLNGIDTVATISWDPFASVPASATARLYSGAYAGVSPSAVHAMNVYWDFDVPAGAYNYNIKLYYRNAWLGSIPSEQNLIGAKKSGSNPWSTYASPQSAVDTALNILTINTLYDFSMFTGTTGSNPVPVKLTTFRAAPVGRDVLVYWTTANERNASHFIVEASADGRNYTAVGRVNAKGNSSVSNNYSLNHGNAQASMGGASVIFYRLTMVDRDGTKEKSQVVQVNFSEKRGQLASAIAYPNPFSSTVNISVPAVNDDKLVLQVTDLQGRMVAKSEEILTLGINEVSLNLDMLQKGIYLIKATTGNGESKVMKVVKE
jgi:trimeric autotransporter adhesin